MKYLILIEKTRTGFSAYSPDLPGCVATGRSRSTVLREMKKAIEFHLEGLQASGRKPPRPRTDSAYVEIPA